MLVRKCERQFLPKLIIIQLIPINILKLMKINRDQSPLLIFNNTKNGMINNSNNQLKYQNKSKFEVGVEVRAES